MKGLLVLLTFFAISCSHKKVRYFTADIEFTCTSKGYFDTLTTFLLTNDMSDIGGKGSGLAGLLNAPRVYKKNHPKRKGHFYIDSLQSREYALLLVECNEPDMLFTGHRRNLDFSDNTSDTLTIEVCVLNRT
jgi:hypothetical protein